MDLTGTPAPNGQPKCGGLLVAVTPAIKHRRFSPLAHFVDVIALVLDLADYEALLCLLYCAPKPSLSRQSSETLVELFIFLKPAFFKIAALPFSSGEILISRIAHGHKWYPVMMTRLY